MKEYLSKYRIIDENNIEKFRFGTRDNSQATVLKCNTTGTKFLDKIYQRIADYQTKDEYGYGAFDLSDCRKETLIDTHRRVNFL
jgi:hypothetical protein